MLFIFLFGGIIMNKKQCALSIIMDMITCKDENIAILYKYKNKKSNTIVIEPIENIENIIIDINTNFDDNLNSEDRSILSLVSFTDGYPDDEDNMLLYAEIMDGIKQNMLE